MHAILSERPIHHENIAVRIYIAFMPIPTWSDVYTLFLQFVDMHMHSYFHHEAIEKIKGRYGITLN